MYFFYSLKIYKIVFSGPIVAQIMDKKGWMDLS